MGTDLGQLGQTRPALGTASAAAPFVAAFALLNPTVPLGSASDIQPRPIVRIGTAVPIAESKRKSSTAGYFFVANGTDLLESPVASSPDRPTTSREIAIGEIRRWAFLDANWDGEGALPPIVASLRTAETFACLWENGDSFEPMLFPSGHAGLLWDFPKHYADLKFLEDGRIAYFIKIKEDRHKGIVAFNGNEIPLIISTLLLA